MELFSQNGKVFIYKGSSFIKSYKIPKGVKVIGSDCFKNCKRLKSVIIPEGVEVIDSNAFENCYSLKNIKLPETLKTIEFNAFGNCRKLSSIIIPNNVKNLIWGAFSNCKNLEYVKLPNVLENLEPELFYNCVSLKKVSFPKQLSSIEESAFENCKSLREIQLPENLSFIGSRVFKNCISLKSINVPDWYISNNNKISFENQNEAFFEFTKGTIGNGTFSRCKNLSYINNISFYGDFITSGKKIVSFLSKGEIPKTFKFCVKYIFSKNKKALGRFLKTYTEKFKIPYFKIIPEYNVNIPEDNKLNTLCAELFNENNHITSVNIPNNIEIIKNRCFCSCKNLRKVKLSHNIQYVDNCAFADCGNLKSVLVPSRFTNFGGYVFIDSKKIRHFRNVGIYKIINNCIVEGEENSSYKADLANILKVSSIAPGAISYSTKILIIPEGIKTIQKNLFYGYSNLVTVKLPQSLEKIEKGSFKNCENLLNIYIPFGVTIEEGAFENCPNLIIDNWGYPHKKNLVMESTSPNKFANN